MPSLNNEAPNDKFIKSFSPLVLWTDSRFASSGQFGFPPSLTRRRRPRRRLSFVVEILERLVGEISGSQLPQKGETKCFSDGVEFHHGLLAPYPKLVEGDKNAAKDGVEVRGKARGGGGGRRGGGGGRGIDGYGRVQG